MDNNNRVDAADFWRWRMLVTIDPTAEVWNAAVDFNENGVAETPIITQFCTAAMVKQHHISKTRKK